MWMPKEGLKKTLTACADPANCVFISGIVRHPVRQSNHYLVAFSTKNESNRSFTVHADFNSKKSSH